MGLYTNIIYINLPDFGKIHYESLVKRVEAIAPSLSEKQIIYACNKITNLLRKIDFLDVQVDGSYYPHSGYTQTYEVEVCGKKFYVTVWRD